MSRTIIAAIVLSTLVVVLSPASSFAADNGTGWLGVVVARGDLKQEIESTPILERPNRPFHFYGNTVRRRYYRGTTAPRQGAFVQGGAAPVVQPKSN